MAKLILTLDGAVIREYPLEKETVSIGRRPGNDIQLNDLAVSGRHALVTHLRRTYIEDLGSTNGTLVNGKRIRKTILEHGDVIQVGSHQITFLADSDQPYEPTMFLRAEYEPTMHLGADEITAGPVRGTPLGAIRILDGPHAGKVMELRKPFNTLGFRGLKVALITRGPRGYTIHGIRAKELRRASDLPVVNGVPVGTGSRPLKDQDVIELVGTKMQFFLLG
ncbi:FHA domain-containing protein [Inmirania thermothiophila]|uniref:FHA domain-containing protein n=1 Tax=Inmirania thermothiophila TaxID=1750597 RepID=A0A3N1XZX7_9GAMM|nr:FHA domain-containing protein [Inmirania thermothiophila]ROR32155.1 FHA domain-containing protein [Inmirania thermothiophila]